MPQTLPPPPLCRQMKTLTILLPATILAPFVMAQTVSTSKAPTLRFPGFPSAAPSTPFPPVQIPFRVVRVFRGSTPSRPPCPLRKALQTSPFELPSDLEFRISNSHRPLRAPRLLREARAPPWGLTAPSKLHDRSGGRNSCPPCLYTPLSHSHHWSRSQRTPI